MEIKKEKSVKKKSFSFNKSQIFWFVFSLLFIWYIIIRPQYNINKLRKKGIETKGYIYRKSGVGSKGTIRCFYTFNVSGETYEGFYDNQKLNQGDSLDIIYYIKDPTLNQAKQFILDY
jgi:hypothetical protein